MKRIFYFLAGAALGIGASQCLWHRQKTETRIEMADTVMITRIDTVVVKEPVVRTVRQVRTDTVRMASIEHDTVVVSLPIEQRHYADSLYDAWVSGYLPQLDSLCIYPRTQTVIVREKAKRWHIGITAGCSLTPRGVQPGVGIGITYTIK